MPTRAFWYDDTETALAERHEQLHRRSQAMWQLLKAKLDLSDAELRSALVRIEHTVPRAERRLLDCSVCRHPVQSNAIRCLYCGTAPHAQPQAQRLIATGPAQH